MAMSFGMGWRAAAAVALLAGLPAASPAAIFVLKADLNGFNETDGAGNFGLGDPDGSGTAIITIDTDTDTVTWSITASDIDLPLTGAHIHEGVAGTNGPVRIDFDATLNGSKVSTFADAVAANPSGFYVNLHNAAFRPGAIRGNLATAVPEPASAGLAVAGGLAVAARLRRRRS